MKLYKKVILVILFTMILGICFSCNGAQQKKDSGSSSNEQPSELQKLLGDIDKTYEALNKIAIEEKEKEKEISEPVLGDPSADQSQGQDSGSEQQKGQEKGGQGKQDEKAKKESEDKSKEEWQKIDTDVEKLHRDWNSYEPKADEENVSRDKITSFEDKLNSLSSEVKDKKVKEALTSVNGLQKEVSEFTGKYKEVIPAQLYDVKYQYQQTYIEALKDEWPKAETQASETLKTWDEAKSDLEKEDKDLAMRMEFSIKDLQDSVTTKDFDVVSIKVKVVTDNYIAIEKIYLDKAKEEAESKKK